MACWSARIAARGSTRARAALSGSPMSPRAFLASILLCSCAAAQTTRIVVISHRGEHLKHPENTIPAVQAAIDAGADFFECDVRTTSDGKLVLMHDGKVDRTTNGHGDVSATKFDEIRALDAGAKFDARFTGVRVPTFDEALELAKGRIGIYVDVKQASAKDLVEAFDRHDMADHVVVYGRRELLKQIQGLRPGVKVMPESVSASVARSLIDELHLRVIAFSAEDFQDDIIAIAREAHAAIYVDRLGAADNPAFWRDAIDRGAAGIQTDKPGDLVSYLKSRGLR
jgi:glycerophosphoryl diester phosphodiesterase